MDTKTQIQSKHDALNAELKRRREGFPAKAFAIFAAMLSILALNLAVGANSLLFIGPAAVVTLFLIVVGINAWGFHRNLHESTQALTNLN
jgi:hypothetical protein